MAIVFDATISGENSNSYSSVEDYNQYRENLGLSVLAEATAKVQLIKATSFIDSNYRQRWLTCCKAVSTQNLHFPQSCAYDSCGSSLADDEIPKQVLEAVYQYAIISEQQGQTNIFPENDGNIKSAILADLEVEYFSKKGNNSLPASFASIDTILYGLISARTGGAFFQERG